MHVDKSNAKLLFHNKLTKLRAVSLKVHMIFLSFLMVTSLSVAFPGSIVEKLHVHIDFAFRSQCHSAWRCINKVAMLEISVWKLHHVLLMSSSNLACMLTSLKEVVLLLQLKWRYYAVCTSVSCITFFLIYQFCRLFWRNGWLMLSSK